MLVLKIVASILAVFSSLAIAMNYYYLVEMRKRPVSLMPIVGGITGTLALTLVPIPRIQAWIWIPLVVDPGCIPMIVVLLFRAARRDLSGKK
jgi:hypothetical protein